MDSSVVAGLIRYRRKFKGLTLEDLARQVDLTPGALSHIENGKRLPDPKNAVKIAAALDIPEEEMLQALDEAHAERRRQSAWSIPPERDQATGTNPPSASGASRRESVHFDVEPPVAGAARIQTPDTTQGEESAWLYPDDVSTFTRPVVRGAAIGQTPRNVARWSEDTPVRLEALEQLATAASEAIRTLRGLLDDDDPVVAKEARRLLRELNVRQMEDEK